MDFERPEKDYLIMESVKSAPAKVIHVFFLNKCSEFKIGRSVDTDMKIADISVSRVHSLIKIRDRQLFIEDNGAKFGTLVKIRDPVEILQGGNPALQASLFQIGRSLVFISSSIMPNKVRKNNRLIRRVEILKNSQKSSIGYIKTKYGKYIPDSFIYRGPRSFVNPK